MPPWLLPAYYFFAALVFLALIALTFLIFFAFFVGVWVGVAVAVGAGVGVGAGTRFTMAEAISTENYEKAAMLRDELKELDSQNSKRG